MAFSSSSEVRCAFTRDYNAIKTELQILEDCDKTCIETALHDVSEVVLAEWGNNTACQVILVTDGNTGVGPMSLTDSLNTFQHRNSSNPFPLPFTFPAKLHIVCITPPDDHNLIKSKPLFTRLVEITGYDGSVLIPDGPLCDANVISMFQKLANDIYTPFKGVLKCGNLESKTVLYPSPFPYTKVTDFDCKTYYVSDVIDVCGFIPVADVSLPMAVSRHLILPANINQEGTVLTKEIDLSINDDGIDVRKVPSFCVLLHDALKVENMAALVTLGENWFGFISSQSKSKKKSNLILTILMPGIDSVPWLGDLNRLISPENVPSEFMGYFPVRAIKNQNYHRNGVEWIREAGLQFDVKRILGHAGKLPERTQQFYRSLNQLRKSAISLGFLDFLTGLASIFDNECMKLPASAHPDCALQLTYAAEILRRTQNKDVNYVIYPLPTNYNP